MAKAVHPLAGTLALLVIATFWFSTALVELFGTVPQVIAVKRAIPWGFILLIPALAATGGTGMVRSRGRSGDLIARKLRRMRLIAANGILVLAPSALFLEAKASAAELDAAFYRVQCLELLAGAANLLLLGLNMRDGLRMSGRLRRSDPVLRAAREADRSPDSKA